jgi:phage N-6-adenine-methyltransferase
MYRESPRALSETGGRYGRLVYDPRDVLSRHNRHTPRTTSGEVEVVSRHLLPVLWEAVSRTKEAEMKVPQQKPGRSKQDYATPPEFIDAVKRKFSIGVYDYGCFDYDLAASKKNSQGNLHFNAEEDSLKQNWGRLLGECWLNPPFANIAPWAEKCARSASPSRRIFFLTPASIGSNWFVKHVWGKACVYFLQGRLSFDGVAPYPKDCILSVFPGTGAEVWDWRKDAY